VKVVRGNPIVAAVVLGAVVLALVLFGLSVSASFGLPFNLSLGLPPTRDYTLRAVFQDANNLNKGAAVVVAGVQIGQVTDVAAQGSQALVTMRIGHDHAPVHRGAIARIRYSTLLAQKFVEISPASGTPAIPDGGTIPSDETITPVDFDQFLDTLDPQTRDRVRLLVQQAGGGVEGEHAVINDLLDQLSQLTVESRGGLSTLHRRDPQLSSILSNLAVASRRLDQSHRRLGDLVGNTATVTGTLAENDQHLDSILVHLAATTEDIDQTLEGNEANLHRTVVTLDPLVGQVNDNFAITGRYVRESNQPLKDGFNYLIPYIGSAVSQRDANGHYLREFLVLDTCYDLQSSQRSRQTSGCLLPAFGSTPSLPAATQLPKALTKPLLPPSPTPRVTPSPKPTPGLLPAPVPSAVTSLLGGL
jgi:virulence factor Mce-like protein